LHGRRCGLRRSTNTPVAAGGRLLHHLRLAEGDNP
jgi:hypothetical protein